MEATDPLEGLPPELMLHVLSFLSPSDLGHATCVSHAWLIFAGDEELWRSRCYAEMRGHVQAVEDLKHKEKIASFRALYPRLLDFPYMEWDERQSAVVTNRGLTARTTRRGETIYTAKQPLRPGAVTLFELTFEETEGGAFAVGLVDGRVAGKHCWIRATSHTAPASALTWT